MPSGRTVCAAIALLCVVLGDLPQPPALGILRLPSGLFLGCSLSSLHGCLALASHRTLHSPVHFETRPSLVTPDRAQLHADDIRAGATPLPPDPSARLSAAELTDSNVFVEGVQSGRRPEALGRCAGARRREVGEI